jgi:hypothetical protein
MDGPPFSVQPSASMNGGKTELFEFRTPCVAGGFCRLIHRNQPKLLTA